jgi:uncharacterized membrane protein YhhN
MGETSVGQVKERKLLLILGLALSVVGLVLMLPSGPQYIFTIGIILFAPGLVLFGIGLRSRMMSKNPRLSNIVLVVASISSVAMIAWYVLF